MCLAGCSCCQKNYSSWVILDTCPFGVFLTGIIWPVLGLSPITPSRQPHLLQHLIPQDVWCIPAFKAFKDDMAFLRQNHSLTEIDFCCWCSSSPQDAWPGSRGRENSTGGFPPGSWVGFYKVSWMREWFLSVTLTFPLYFKWALKHPSRYLGNAKACAERKVQAPPTRHIR